MMTYKSLHDRAVVSFTGDVDDWTSVCQLTDLVDTLVERHFHTRIELVIASPGGVVAALDHYLECTGRWRARGVRLRTRVVSHAFSAAAVMLSLGDERVAGRGARLLYHPARVHDAGPITARESTEMHDALRRIDDAMVARLVARVLDGRGPPARVPYAAEPSDRRGARRPGRGRCGASGGEAAAPARGAGAVCRAGGDPGGAGGGPGDAGRTLPPPRRARPRHLGEARTDAAPGGPGGGGRGGGAPGQGGPPGAHRYAVAGAVPAARDGAARAADPPHAGARGDRLGQERLGRAAGVCAAMAQAPPGRVGGGAGHRPQARGRPGARSARPRAGAPRLRTGDGAEPDGESGMVAGGGPRGGAVAEHGDAGAAAGALAHSGDAGAGARRAHRRRREPGVLRARGGGAAAGGAGVRADAHRRAGAGARGVARPGGGCGRDGLGAGARGAGAGRGGRARGERAGAGRGGR